MQILVIGTSRMDVSMGTVRSTASITVDPFQPMLGTVASDQVLKVVRDRNVLAFGSTQEVLHDRVFALSAMKVLMIKLSLLTCVVAKANFDRSLESMKITIVACALVCLVLLHQWNELLSSPTLGLEVVVVGGRSTSVHLVFVRKADIARIQKAYHEVDATAAALDRNVSLYIL